MMKKCKQENECIERQYNNRISHIHYNWFIFCLIEFIVVLLTYKLWGKSAPLENLISIGSGLISIVLGLFAIIYSVSESIKTNNKENKVNSMLDEIEHNVLNMSDIVSNINQVTNSSFNELKNIKKISNETKESISKFNFEEFNKQANEKEANTIKTADSDLYAEVVVRPSKEIILREFKKGDLCTASLVKKDSSILSGVRPVIVVQNNITNKYAPSLTVIPVTTANKSNIPTHISFNFKTRVCIAVVEQITTISKDSIIKFLDEMDDEVIKEIDKALLFQLEI